MLNRLYIVVGVLAILVLAAAFIVPRFIAWGDYRERMEEIATAAVGAPVEIIGDIEFSLLPAPKLRFSDVIIGPAEEPVVMIASVEADFSLFDFLRDRYNLTRLVLDEPRIELSLNEQGAFETGLSLAAEVSETNVSIASADIVGGTIRLADARTDEVFALDDITGELRLSALRGPFSFAGTGTVGAKAYSLRIGVGAAGEGGATLSVFVQPVDGAFSIAADGAVSLYPSPRFVGDLVYRQEPPSATEADAVRGDLVVTSKAELAADQLLLSAYTIVPDENRAGTRLTGAAVLKLGDSRSFDAVISGGALALPPRDATAEEGVQPYELVRLLAELPSPFVPGVPGTIGVDIAELDLRAVSLRQVRFDAVTDARGWTLSDFSAELPGGADLQINGELIDADGKPAFAGTMSLTTSRLDALAALWRRPAEGSPLFNVPASMSAEVALGAEALSLTGGRFTFDGTDHAFTAAIGFGETRRLEFAADFSALSALDSTAVAALFPDATGDPAFGLTFPRGRVALSAETATVFGLAGRDLAAAAHWEGGLLEVERIAAADLGGAAFDAKLTAFGTLARPEAFGDGSLNLGAESAPALGLAFDLFGTPEPMREALLRHLPADLALRLEPPGGDGSQTLSAAGRVGSGQLDFSAMLGRGVLNALSGPLNVRLDLTAADAGAMTDQLGLGALSLFPETGPMHVAAVIDGTLANSLETSVLIEGGGDSLGFAGNVVVTDPEQWRGSGVLRTVLSDPAAVADSLGLNGLYLPRFSGTGELEFAGLESIVIDQIDARAAGQRVSGNLALRTDTTGSSVSGALQVATMDVSAMVAALAGPASLIASGMTLWPDGPIAIGDAPRTTTGRVTITTDAIGHAGVSLVSEASFDIDWDATSISLRALQGRLGGGVVTVDLAICCAGPLPDKTVTGRATVSAAALDALLPPLLADALGGTVDLGVQFEGTGDSVSRIIQALAGEGSFSVAGLSVERFDPGTFASVAGLDNILELEPDALSALVTEALNKGAFAAPQVGGSFTIAGGVLRSANLAVDGPGVRLFGGAQVELADMSLDGSYTLTPIGDVDPDGLINETTSRITAELAGTLIQPVRTLDLTTMVDGIKVRAYELELEELERLRAEDEARIAAQQAQRLRYLSQQNSYRRAVEVKRVAELDAAAAAAALEMGSDVAGEVALISRRLTLNAIEAAAEADRVAAEQAAAAAQEAAVTDPPPVTTTRPALPPLNLTPTESPNRF